MTILLQGKDLPGKLSTASGLPQHRDPPNPQSFQGSTHLFEIPDPEDRSGLAHLSRRNKKNLLPQEDVKIEALPSAPTPSVYQQQQFFSQSPLPQQLQQSSLQPTQPQHQRHQLLSRPPTLQLLQQSSLQPTLPQQFQSMIFQRRGCALPVFVSPGAPNSYSSLSGSILKTTFYMHKNQEQQKDQPLKNTKLTLVRNVDMPCLMA